MRSKHVHLKGNRMEDLSGCKHEGVSCGSTCACWCDPCQEVYESNWTVQATTHGLCDYCGVPKGELTWDLLDTFQYAHFFLGCTECQPRIEAVLTQKGLCTMCRCPLEGAMCPQCVCTDDTTPGQCRCRECNPPSSGGGGRTDAAGAAARRPAEDEAPGTGR